MKKLVCAAVAVGSLNLFAATIYRDATNVTSLVEFLNEDRAGNLMVIRLAKGDYDLTGVEMTSGNHLYLEQRAIVGQGDSPWETRLIGDGTKRILNAKNDVWFDGNRNCRIENLTCTNGYTTGQGGAVSGYPWVVGCVIIGNKANQGGGLGGYTYGVDSIIANNTSVNSGGGIYNSNFLRNCVVYGNHAGGSGGAIASENYGSVSDCVFSNNTAGASGGAVSAVRIVERCIFVGNSAGEYGGGLVSWVKKVSGDANYRNRIVDCTISNNTATLTGGGVYGYHVTNTLLVANSGKQGGGACSARELYKCRILDNTASSCGGGVYKSKAIECFISGNLAHGNGGGVYADIGDAYALVDSVLCSNKTDNVTEGGYGGGAYSYFLTNVAVFANYGMHGGGTSRCDLYDCDVHDNYGSGLGGGVYSASRVEKSKVWNNVSSGTHGNGYSSNFIDCDISGTGVHQGWALNCTFHDIGKEVVLANPYKQVAVSNATIWTGVPIATNCLFVNNRTSTYRYEGSVLYPAAYGQHLFQGADGSTRQGALVNCTIVSNALGQTFSFYRTKASPVFNVENCVFFGNCYYWGNVDITCYDVGAVLPECIKFKNCAYGISGNLFSNMADYTAPGSELFKFGANGFPSKPGFMYEKDPEHPYALKRSSPLRNRGAYEDWMASATDIRGEGYARATEDHKVDIGCYQCWIPAPGGMLFLR